MTDNVIYVVVDCCSGEDYSADDPTVLFVTNDLESGIQFFENEIENWEDGLEDFDSNKEIYEDGKIVYECTDFEGDSHRILKLVKTIIE
jgi:hypothetical protein